MSSSNTLPGLAAKCAALCCLLMLGPRTTAAGEVAVSRIQALHPADRFGLVAIPKLAIQPGRPTKLRLTLESPKTPATENVDVPAVLKKVQSGNRDEKLAALRLLRNGAVDEKLADQKLATIKLCVQLLQDPDREIGNAACDVLSWLDADALPPLVRALESKDPWIQATAALAIGSIVKVRKPETAQTDTAIAPLAKLLRAEDKSARHNAFYAISELGPRALPHMIDALDAEDYFQWVMMRAFVRHGEKSVEPLCKALRNGDVTRRRNAAFMLFHIAWQAPDALPRLESHALAPLTEAIRDDDRQVRARAIDTLGRMQHRAKPALDKIVAAIQQPDAPLGSIASAAGQIGPEINHLDALFDGAEQMVATASSANERERAVEAFGQAIGAVDESGLDRIVQALDDSREAARMTAMWALYHLGPKGAPAVPRVIEKLNSGDRLATAVLGAVGPAAKEAVPHLIRRLEHDTWVRSRLAFSIAHDSPCAQALARIGRPAIPALLEGLNHKNDLVRVGCVIALKEMDVKSMALVSALEPLCGDKHPLIRVHAMLALVRQGLAKEQLVTILKRMQDDVHAGVARAARQELARLQPSKN